MPTKRQPRVIRKKKGMKTRKGVKSPKVKGSMSKDMVIYMSPKGTPIPSRFRTKLTAAIYGYEAAGITNSQYAVNLNSIYQPFNGGTWTNALPAIATLQPTGFASFLNVNFYRKFRVYGSKIEIEFLPQALTDTVECVITPAISGVAPVNTANAMAQPFSKSSLFSSSKQNIFNGKLKNYMTVHQLLGVSKTAVENDLSGQLNGAYNADPVLLYNWYVTYTTPDNAVTAVALEYRCKVTWYVEMFQPAYANFLEV